MNERIRELADQDIVDQIVNLLMIQHEAAAGRHNYYHHAANLIKAEFGVEIKWDASAPFVITPHPAFQTSHMNEQIKKLAEQAGFCMWIDEPWNPGDVIDWSSRYDKELEKFAELIVRESIEVMKRHDYHGEWLGEKIREHFGLE